MKLVEAVAEDVMIVEAYGRIDSTTAKEFGDRLVSLVQGGRGSLVVDLKNIAYISSAGFRALLFDIGGFSNEFIICATQADGIGKLRQ
jgi:anti-anti-sigma factor